MFLFFTFELLYFDEAMKHRKLVQAMNKEIKIIEKN